MTLRTGDLVRITYEGRSVEGKVYLASENGRSVILDFDAMLGDAEGAYVGSMPVAADDHGGYVDLLHGKPVLIEPLDP